MRNPSQTPRSILSVAAALIWIAAPVVHGATRLAMAAEPGQGAAATESGTTPRIVNGLESQGFPNVGALLRLDGALHEMACSGTMIGCRTFLTAAHCVCPDPGDRCQAGGNPAQGDHPPNPAEYRVFLQHAGIFDVQSIRVNEDFGGVETLPSLADVAIVTLADDVPRIEPARINRTPGSMVGVAGTIVGFGLTGSIPFGVDAFLRLDSGIKRMGGMTGASCVNPGPPPPAWDDERWICWSHGGGAAGVDSGICFADSGGPVFMDVGGRTVVAGVAHAVDNLCRQNRLNFDTNISAYRAWVENVGGHDATLRTCGVQPHIDTGSGRMTIHQGDGELTASAHEFRGQFTVDAGAAELRLAMNGQSRSPGPTTNADWVIEDFDLYVNLGGAAAAVPAQRWDLTHPTMLQYEYGTRTNPVAGEWHYLVVPGPSATNGVGRVQVTATILRHSTLEGGVFGGWAVVTGGSARLEGKRGVGAAQLPTALLAGSACASRGSIGPDTRTDDSWVLTGARGGGSNEVHAMQAFPMLAGTVGVEGDIATGGAAIASGGASDPSGILLSGFSRVPGHSVVDFFPGGVMDTTNRDSRLNDCREAQGAIADVATQLDALSDMPPLPAVVLEGDDPANDTLSLTAAKPGKLNVFRFKRLRARNFTTLELDAAGDPATSFLLRFDEGFDLDAQVNTLLMNGARAENVIFYVKAGKCEVGRRNNDPTAPTHPCPDTAENCEGYGGTLFCPESRAQVRGHKGAGGAGDTPGLTNWAGAVISGRGVVLRSFARIHASPFRGGLLKD